MTLQVQRLLEMVQYVLATLARCATALIFFSTHAVFRRALAALRRAPSVVVLTSVATTQRVRTRISGGSRRSAG